MSYIYSILTTVYLSIGLKFIEIIPWTIIFLFLQSYRIKYYILTKSEECKKIQKYINNFSSEQTDNEKGIGYSFGYWYILHLSVNHGESDLYKIIMIATEDSYKLLTKEIDIYNIKNEESDKLDNDNSKKINKIIIFDRLGSYHNPWYRKRYINIQSVTPRLDQQIILDKIISHQKKQKHTVIYLSGTPGSGKSMIGIFLAEHYNGNYCNTLIPWQPGDSLNSIYSEVEPTEKKPLIIVLEEVDIPLIQIHTNQIEKHKNLPIMIKDKTGWNHLFDSINRGIFPYLIILMTSNKSHKNINELDKSYLRKGRVDLILELNHEQVEDHEENQVKI
jgi:hypothetical protein